MWGVGCGGVVCVVCVYILLNWHHHLAEQGRRPRSAWFDTFSSAATFDGWIPGVVVWRDRGLEPGKVPGRKLPYRVRENGNSSGCVERLTDRAWIVEGEEEHAPRVVFLMTGEVVLDRGFLGEGGEPELTRALAHRIGASRNGIDVDGREREGGLSVPRSEVGGERPRAPARAGVNQRDDADRLALARHDNLRAVRG